MLTSVPFFPPTLHLVIVTDTSTVEWKRRATAGNYTVCCPREYSCHINILEMRAVEIMLTQKGFELARLVVCLLSVYISVVFYLNKQGGTRSRRLTTVAERVLRLAESLDIVLQAAHIRGKHNVLADILSSQQTVLKIEWRLGRPNFL